MKKLLSIFFALSMAFALAISANAAEVSLRLFSLAPEKNTSSEEVLSYAEEKNFGGILLDLRKSDSLDFYKKLSSAAPENFKIYVLAKTELLEKLPEEANAVFENGASEEEISSVKCENISLYLPFGEDSSSAKNHFEKGFFKTLFAEILLSSHSEYGYEEYLLETAEKFSGADIITVNDLSRVLSPVTKGDFYGDAYELNNQYLISKIHSVGFCVSDYSALCANKFGSASYLTDYFNSEILDTYADFSISEKFAITRPVGNSLNVATEKYTIFGTSNPDKPLYMDGAEVERISSGGVFAVTVDVPKKGATYAFSQDGQTIKITLKRSSSGGGVSTTKKLTSLYPSASVPLENGNTEVTLSCVGPSGGYVSAAIGGKTYKLKQVAYADAGVPAKFTAKIDLSGEYPAGEVTDLGKVTYNLSYNGKNTSYESTNNLYFIGENAVLAVRANCELAGVERIAKENGDYLTTLRTGCADYVTEIAENGWYALESGGFVKPSQFDIITGDSNLTNNILFAEREIGDNYEKLVLHCTELPAFYGEINGKIFSITLTNTQWSDFSSTDMESSLMYRINPIDNGDGTITVKFFSKEKLWGWDVFTDYENKTFSIVLKGTPSLSYDPAKPLAGITAAVCAGHGGPDPGALSVAGEKGVNEAEINLANAMAIAESLENLGANIVLLTTTDEKLDTYGRTDPARYAYSDVYICCHANSVAENSAANLWCGTYVYYHYDHSAEFSKKLCDYISASTNRDNEGAQQDYYSVTRLTMCPAVMLEVGFVSNPKELESLIDPVDIQKTAHAVTKAVMEILDN
ncbi:MAG: N-acetylmuramoyl-L-alanine amidase [Oscillospiraceae bacterium]|nr:N-acetylmuramoyl-L-alanine amidase [Oscillospiraceae bacterium]